jgi:hypothetical protein
VRAVPGARNRSREVQVDVHKWQRPIANPEAIERALRAYQFPLYFLDHEAFALAIPAFDTYLPALQKDR